MKSGSSLTEEFADLELVWACAVDGMLIGSGRDMRKSGYRSKEPLAASPTLRDISPSVAISTSVGWHLGVERPNPM